MKEAVVYLRKEKLFVRSRSRTVDGIWIGTGPCFAIDCKSFEGFTDFEQLGDRVLEALSLSKIEVEHPVDWSAVTAPLLNAAGVGTWGIFGKLAKCVEVALSDDLVLRPTKNHGARGGFQVLEGKIVQVPGTVSSADLGLSVMAALSSSES